MQKMMRPRLRNMLAASRDWFPIFWRPRVGGRDWLFPLFLADFPSKTKTKRTWWTRQEWSCNVMLISSLYRCEGRESTGGWKSPSQRPWRSKLLGCKWLRLTLHPWLGKVGVIGLPTPQYASVILITCSEEKAENTEMSMLGHLTMLGCYLSRVQQWQQNAWTMIGQSSPARQRCLSVAGCCAPGCCSPAFWRPGKDMLEHPGTWLVWSWRVQCSQLGQLVRISLWGTIQ